MKRDWGDMGKYEECHDKDGRLYIVDSDGNKYIPEQVQPIGESSGWMEYDTSQGHCGLCGRLTCRGFCTK
jgi:hypothetical protein